ncbi:MAG: glutamate 5-kinase [Candidatus Gygaella obscura]|nr:glutamate 5-kinase [Candidatus Gygaella obscura]
MNSQKRFKRLVIKIGSSVFADAHAKINTKNINKLCGQFARLKKMGIEVVVVSSGAVASGMSLLKLKNRPNKISDLQALASLGQVHLVDLYQQYLTKYSLKCAQILLTWDDFNIRTRYLNAKNTLLKVLEFGYIPIVNENDVVSTDEIKFGDNDKLSSLVAVLLEADLLVVLTDVEGLYDKQSRVVNFVERITKEIESFVKTKRKKSTVGGMFSKLQAAKISVDAGISCLVADGRKKDILLDIVKGKILGTLFSASTKSLGAKKRWLAFSSKISGRINVDKGAEEALKRHKSLLSVGIVDCKGSFSKGDSVDIVDTEGNIFAKGIVECSVQQLNSSMGTRTSREIVHCDNLVILG